MKIQTDTGELEIAEEDIVRFQEGLYGFESVKEYVLLAVEDAHGIFSMQAVHSRVPSFILLDPYAVVDHYAPKLSKEDLDLFGVSDEKEMRFLVIASLKEDYQDTEVNLKSPVAIHPGKKVAKQVIVNNDYPIRAKVFQKGFAGV